MTKEKKFIPNSLRIMGATGIAREDREENDFYATEPKAVELLLELETFKESILEPCCGQGHIAEVLKRNGYKVVAEDLIDRGYGIPFKDFLKRKEKWEGDLITNPPYKIANEFLKKALEVTTEGSKIAFFVKIQFLESKERFKIFKDFPPKVVYISSSRLNCAKNGDFDKYKSSAQAYIWIIWEKGYKGETLLKWFNGPLEEKKRKKLFE